MLKTLNGGQVAKSGFYFNLADWTMHVAPKQGEVLPGAETTRYLALPTAMILVAAPVISLAFVIFLPFIGLALLVKAAIDKALSLRPATQTEPRQSDCAH